MAEVQLLDPWDVMQRMAQKDRQVGNRRRSERVGYYLRPTVLLDGRPAHEPGWVIIADTQPGKQVDMVSRGFRPLPQFGRVWDHEGDEDGRLYLRYGRWGPILSKPGGPEAFPVEQILAYRWYDPKQIGAPAEGFEAMSFVRFPQLHQAVKDGLKIAEYRCPECNAVKYLAAVHLARHLRNAHSWDRRDILDWGTALGIDFRSEFSVRPVRLVDLDDFQVSPPPVEELPVAVEAAWVPTRAEAAEIAARPPCVFCNRAKVGVCKRHR